MLDTLTGAAKTKALIAAFAFLILGGLCLAFGGDPGIMTAAETKDPYTLDIQERANLVNNVVSGVIDQQGKEEAWKYRQTCENANSFIQKQYLETNQLTTLTAEQRQINADFKEYLHESSFVVATCYAGKAPDLVAMNDAKEKLF